MNRHFKDTQYYLRRAAATAKHGVSEELEPVRTRAARLRADEEEQDDGRLARARTRVTTGVRRARAEIERAVVRGRERIELVRRRSAE